MKHNLFHLILFEKKKNSYGRKRRQRSKRQVRENGSNGRLIYLKVKFFIQQIGEDGEKGDRGESGDIGKKKYDFIVKITNYIRNKIKKY